MSVQDANKVPFWYTFLAGGASGTIGAVITCPLEVVKTRLQSSLYHEVTTSIPGSVASISFRSSPIRATWSHVAGTLNALRGIYVNEGLTALWKGGGATLVGVMPARAIHFSAYTNIKEYLKEVNKGVENSWIHLTSAATAGVITATATNPIWVVKTKMQLQSNRKDGVALPYRNSLHCVRKIVEKEGIRGLYRGMTASYMGCIEGTMQWVLYEKLKKGAMELRLKQKGMVVEAGQLEKMRASEVLGWFDYFAVAAGAKLIAAVIAYPHEVFRTRLREDSGKYRGLFQTAARVWKEEGTAGLYGGMTAHLLRVVPNSAIMFFCYELFIHSYQSLRTTNVASS